MTQRSQPAQDHINNFPTSDAGPYSADEWSDMFASLFSTDVANQGPLIRYLNELLVTLNAAGPPPVFRVATGAAMIDGHWFKNDANVDFTIPLPAANPRIDRVVVAVNNTAVAYTVSDLGFTLDFPDALADYNGTNSIEPYSTRLCIVQGAEGGAPVAPGLDQNNNHFMIPLYQYQINVAGATSGAVDQRDWVYFGSTIGTRQFWVPTVLGYNQGLAADINLAPQGTAWPHFFPNIALDQQRDSAAFGNFVIPEDYYRNMVVTGVWFVIGAAAGNVYCCNYANYGACAETLTTHQDNTGFSAVAVVTANLQIFCQYPLALTAPTPGDLVNLVYRRDASDVLDTLDANDLYFLGWTVEYEAKS